MKKAFFVMAAAVISISVHAGSPSIDCISNGYLGVNVNIINNTGYEEEFCFDMGTSNSHSPMNARLSYDYLGACVEGSFLPYSSRIVLRVDNDIGGAQPGDKTYNFHDYACTRLSYSNNGTTITAKKRCGGMIDLTAIWSLVNNPETGVNADTVKFKFIAENIDSISHTVALRFMIDTKVINNDGTNISIDNGFNVITHNTRWQKAVYMPENWWDYDVAPDATVTPALVGRGHILCSRYDPMHQLAFHMSVDLLWWRLCGFPSGNQVRTYIQLEF